MGSHDLGSLPFTRLLIHEAQVRYAGELASVMASNVNSELLPPDTPGTSPVEASARRCG